MNTEFYSLDPSFREEYEKILSRCADVIERGGLVAFPTETVYGLGASALSEDAAKKIYEAKGRPQDNPLIIHVASPDDIDTYCEADEVSRRIAENFMPGPITVIMKKKPIVPDTVTAGLDTVAVRCPQSRYARDLIAAAGVAIAAPSANSSGRPSPTSASHVYEDMNGKIDVILDGGECEIGLESTIVRAKGSKIELLRPGGITPADIESVFGPGSVIINDAILKKLADNEKPISPGMKYRHYSPKAPVVLVDGECDADKNAYILRAQKNGGRVGILCFDEDMALFNKKYVRSLGARGDFFAQSRSLFARLRDFDSTDVEIIYAKTPPKDGIGLALYNRLIKAAGFDIVYAPKRSLRIALCGGSGSGKGEVARILREAGYPTVDTDEICHSLYSANGAAMPLLIEAFGTDICAPDGSLDRVHMASLVFADTENARQSRETLNRIMHALVREQTLSFMEEHRDASAVFAEIPLLFESGMDADFDLCVAVLAPEDVRISRITMRDGISPDMAHRRIKSQHCNDFLRERCDFSIENDEDIKKLSRGTHALLEAIGEVSK